MFHILLLFLLGCRAEFADDLQSYEQECLGEERFHCMDGGCVRHTQYCDGRADCADGSDENFCPDHRPDEHLCNVTHQFLCRDALGCLPSTWVCNGAPDCMDASDEANCTTTITPTNTKCKGFTCGDGTCISSLWACDGRYDCLDRSDEDIERTCRHALQPHTVSDGVSCDEFLGIGPRMYKCPDESFCLTPGQMCDGVVDCRDKSDEGPFCDHWKTMCVNSSCPANITECTRERTGPRCICSRSATMQEYNHTTGQCQDVDDCMADRPRCSHRCQNRDGHFTCHCDAGYDDDKFSYLCFARGPEAMLFYSTSKDIRYFKLKSNQEVIVPTATKEAHGVSYDGKYLYWVETADGHQAIARAHLDHVAETKQILVSLGLEDPGDIAVDWLAGNIYFSDSERGTIAVCKTDGSICTTLRTDTKRPRFVTLDVRDGTMYWADYHKRPIIMRARMDGSQPEVLLDDLKGFATGLSMDAPNGRLYFVDLTIRVVKVDTRQVYSLFDERNHHPYAIAVFENTVYWSDWTTNTILSTDKLHATSQKRNSLVAVHARVYDMQIYHPVMVSQDSNPCAAHNCSHLCLLTSNNTFACACPEGMILNGYSCLYVHNYRPQNLVVGGGAAFTRIQYDTLGNPETHATTFDIGRVQAMAYDSRRDILYVYDSIRRNVNSINMSEFTLGVTRLLFYDGFENIVDMDYDYVTDSLYTLDADRRYLEVFSLKTEKRALVHRFLDQETPVSFCILPDYGRLLVAVVESEENNEIHIDSMGLDGEDRQHLVLNNLKGPHVTLRYAANMDNVYMADESSGAIDYIHPKGTGRETFRRLSTTVTSLAVTDTLVFWTDRRTPKLFWAEVLETTARVRRMELSIFPNDTHLYIQATSRPNLPNPFSSHPCTLNPCSDVCVQTPHPDPSPSYGFKCLCPPGLHLEGTSCSKPVACPWENYFCHRSNQCLRWAQKCDGKMDCTHGEDEEYCPEKSNCLAHQIECNGGCINEYDVCPKTINVTIPVAAPCELGQFQCHDSGFCLGRAQVCDQRADCADGSDEGPAACDTLSCGDHEFRCALGSCIINTWRCDGDPDCGDGSDEVDCESRMCSAGLFQCRAGQCIDMSKRCDQTPDCMDGSDEDGCQDVPPDTTVSQSDNNTVPGCVCRHDTRCDQTPDCMDGSDEDGCQDVPPDTTVSQSDNNTVPGCVCRHDTRCDQTPDCMDGSDEDGCQDVPPDTTVSQSDNNTVPGCVCRHDTRCDQTPDCMDGSDEDGCQDVPPDTTVCQSDNNTVPGCVCRHDTRCDQTPNCMDGGEDNSSALCNSVVDCPGGTDENGCEFRCAIHGLFECKQEQLCVSMRRVCDGNRDCVDGSDETSDACGKVNKTSRLFPPAPYPPAECRHGFLCRTGQCVEWHEVCDSSPDCFDGSDENGTCFTACENNTCTHRCQPTPLGPHCMCNEGFRLHADGRTCEDIDECGQDACAQRCHNTPGSFLCHCRPPYGLRSDRRSCKALKGSMSILYVAGNKVQLVSEQGYGRVEYEDKSIKGIGGVDVYTAKNKFYVTAPEAGKLIEVSGSKNVSITNIGKPTKVAVDWVTGNVYFVDATPRAGWIRVCNFQDKRCAKLHKLPGDAVVTSLVVSPGARRLFFCMEHESSSVIWGGDLGGLKGADFTVEQCTGLAVDDSALYVAGIGEIWRLDAGLTDSKKLVTSDKHLQAPRSAAVFEDHVYVLSEDFKINRCLTYGKKTCQPYIYRLYGAESFVIRHEALQPELKNECAGHACPHVCVLGRGPLCVCHDGTIARDRRCPLLDKAELPLFNGWPSQDFLQEHHVSVTLITITVVLFAMYLAVFVYYHCVYRPRNAAAALTLPVRFQNQTSLDGSQAQTPTIEMPTTSGPRHEFVNPLQFVRNAWQRSFRSQRPVGTAGISFEIPRPTEDIDVSDTESDMDFKADEKMLIR